MTTLIWVIIGSGNGLLNTWLAELISRNIKYSFYHLSNCHGAASQLKSFLMEEKAPLTLHYWYSIGLVISQFKACAGEGLLVEIIIEYLPRQLYPEFGVLLCKPLFLHHTYQCWCYRNHKYLHDDVSQGQASSSKVILQHSVAMVLRTG